ncbi:D-2-hydroxyacid dehydrogenase [Burkholderia sp. WAC0059]|uniref:D-2-hydroxyacid dehydrogenase n=1 Tax=Burkholderia sp. WAC0059 TaxID=2066022 RepID=UPI0021556004|nr:D-2-hydroxyacid dehydrogenase [Burkholderia sp. WAC0059]
MDILLSRAAAERFGDAVANVLGDTPHRIFTPGDGPDRQADIAFISRDVTGRSTKAAPSDELLAFYAVLRRSTRLRWVQAHSAGTDRPIFAELLQRGVTVTTSSGANAGAVAQSALGGLLALARRFVPLYEAQRRHAWQPNFGEDTPRDLAGQHALVVGYGPIGQRLARLLGALEMNVTVVRREAPPPAPAPAGEARPPAFVTFAQFDEALPQTDWLILACPLTPLTARLVDARRLARLPARAHLVNVARGEVVVEAALADALSRGALAGAWLDVFEREPLDAASPLWDLPGVLISPHTAGHSDSYYDAVGRIWLDNLARWKRGVPLVNAVPPQPAAA